MKTKFVFGNVGNNFIRRFLCILLALIVLICSFSIPTFAVADQVVDILDFTNLYYQSGDDWLPFTEPVLVSEFPFIVKYDPVALPWLDSIILNLQYFSNQRFTSVQLFDFNGSYYYDGSLEYSSESFEQWAFVDPILDSTYLVFDTDANSVLFEIASFNGQFSNAETIPSISYYWYSYFLDNSGTLQKRYQQSVTQPVGSIKQAYYTSSEMATQYFDSAFTDWYVDIIRGNIGKSVSGVVVLLNSSTNNADIGVGLYAAGSNDPTDVVPIETFSVTSFSIDNSGRFPLATYAVYIDLEGYDLEKNNVSIYIRNDFDIYSSGSYFNQLSVESAYVLFDRHVEPWYKVFWNWLSGGLHDLGEKIVKAINGTPEGTDPLDEPGNQLATQASEFNEAVDIMESVTRPSVDFNGMLDDMIQPDPLAINAMQAITGEKWVTSLLIMVVTLGICSLILFGKRK